MALFVVALSDNHDHSQVDRREAPGLNYQAGSGADGLICREWCLRDAAVCIIHLDSLSVVGPLRVLFRNQEPPGPGLGFIDEHEMQERLDPMRPKAYLAIGVFRAAARARVLLIIRHNGVHGHRRRSAVA